MKLHVRTVILSDVHLGTPDSKVEEVNHFLRHVRCAKLILNGDIIDGWQLRRGGSWTKAHTRFVRIVLKMLEKRDTEVVYLRGNHDDILSTFLPLEFEKLSVVEEHVHEGLRGRKGVVRAGEGNHGVRALRQRVVVAVPEEQRDADHVPEPEHDRTGDEESSHRGSVTGASVVSR